MENLRPESSIETADAAPIASFFKSEDVEISTALGVVKKAGKEQYIRQQSFQVLIYLIEHRKRLVGKEELIEKFWHETAVTDNALVQCIADIRKVLGDDSRHPIFIKTFPKVGYRFIAPVESGPLAISPHSLAGNAKPPESRRSYSVLFLTIAVLAAVMALLLYRGMRQPHLEITLPRMAGRKPVAVMYFENQSHLADLNWLREGLADMFITDLSHSARMTVLSRQQLQMLLERIGYRSSNDIRLDEALEIARRSHAEEVILGSFAKLGEGLLINVQTYQVDQGRLLAADRLVVNRIPDLIDDVDVLSQKLSAHLGIAPANAGQQSGLADVMTKNFEAYRYYSLGVTKARGFENTAAVALLKKAIQLDPQFAMAYARIGYAYSVTDFLPQEGRPYLERAFALTNRLSEKDRLYVIGWYAISREDYESAMKAFRQIIAEYPFEQEAYSRLARLLYREERAEQAIALARQGIAADPDAGDLYNVLGICFLGLHRYDEAIDALQRYVQLIPKEPNAYDSLGMAYQQAGKYHDAEAGYKAALLLEPRFEPAIIHLGDVYAQQGRYRDAIHEYQRYVKVTGWNRARAVAYGSIAQLFWRRGDFQRGEQAARKETMCERSAVWNSLLYALHRKDATDAENLKQRLFQNAPYPERGARQELRSDEYYLGTLALREKRPQEAIEHFKSALRHLPPSSGLDLYEDCLGNAYLELGKPDEAIAEYQRIRRLNANYPLLQYHLAQAYEQKRDCRSATDSYRLFLQNWKQADADLPEVKEAKAKLQGRACA